MNDTLRNILLGITSAVTIVAILEAAGIIEVIDKDTDKATYQIAGYCDNTNRDLLNGVDGGGLGIDSLTAADLLKKARERIESDKWALRHEYFLSKSALDELFNSDLTATGVYIAPYFDELDSINVIVGKAHSKNTLIDNHQKFAFVIKTFCPADCEME